MPAFISAFDVFLGFLRTALFVLAILVAILALLDWLVRTRNISPFSPVARFTRRVMDPLMAPVERRVVNAGGLPASAPWWTLAAVVVGSLVLLALLGFVRTQLIYLAGATRMGVPGLLRLLIMWTFSILQIALIIRVISSWISISPYSRWIRWTFVLTEPILRPLRSVIPLIGMIDITPIVAYFLLAILRSLLLSVI